MVAAGATFSLMSIRTRLKALAINAYLSESVQRTERQLGDLKRRARKEPRRVELYYQAGDPYSHLLVQLLARLQNEQPYEGAFYPVTPPASDVDPAPALQQAYSLQDARMLARRYGLAFPEGPASVSDAEVVRVNQALIIDRPFAQQLEAALALGTALWSGDREALSAALGTYGKEASGGVPPVLATNYARMRDRAHYRGGSIFYGGAWYTGVDRFTYLEAELARSTEQSAPAVLSRVGEEIGYDDLPVTEDGARLEVEFYFSFRSPYSYLALERTFSLAERYPIDLRIRPVLPMVMRSLAVPKIKSMYIVKDAKREADRLGIPFGRICDPVGVGVERCLAVYHSIASPEVARKFMLTAARGIWSQALDVADDGDLHTICEQAGVAWVDAKTSLADESWRETVEENREALFAAGMWGVPGFRVGGLSLWGQDRIDVLEEILERYAAAHPSSTS